MILSKYFSENPVKFWIKMVAGLIMGIIIGSYIGPDSIFLEPMRVIGMIFIRLLNFAVFPLLLLSGIRCFVFLRQNRRLFIILVKSLGYFVLLTAIGATIGIVLGDVMQPGLGVAIRELESPLSIQYPGTSQFIVGVVPDSFLQFIESSFGMLSIIFIAFLIGVGILLAGEDSAPFLELVESIDNTIHRLNLIILEFLPIGIFAYIGYQIGFMTSDSVMPYLKLILVIVAGSFIHIFIVQALLVFFLTKINPFKFIHAVIPAAIIGWMSGNRHTAYPVLVENIEHNLGAERQVFTFVAGLGTTFSLSGSGIAAGVSTLFVAQAYGLDLSVYLQIIIVLLITVSTLKLDGLREGGLILLSVVLAQIIKLPAEGYALILGVTGIIFQIETVVNVMGNAAVSFIVSRSEGSAVPITVRDFI
jgi:Na+/H+-dicarboxylate symporter